MECLVNVMKTTSIVLTKLEMVWQHDFLNF
jgi:hypothetical protein